VTGALVIGFGRGGLLETVREDERGVFFAEPTADQFCAAIERFESRGWEHAAIRDGVLSFGPTRFEAEIDRWLADELGRSD